MQILRYFSIACVAINCVFASISLEPEDGFECIGKSKLVTRDKLEGLVLEYDDANHFTACINGSSVNIVDIRGAANKMNEEMLTIFFKSGGYLSAALSGDDLIIDTHMRLRGGGRRKLRRSLRKRRHKIQHAVRKVENVVSKAAHQTEAEVKRVAKRTERVVSKATDQIEREGKKVAAPAAAIGATVLTGGWGGAFATGFLGMTAGTVATSVISGAVGGCVAATAGSVAGRTVAHRGNMGRAVKGTFSHDSLRDIGIATVSGGISSGILTKLDLPPQGSQLSLRQKLQQRAVQGTVSGAVDTAAGGRASTAFRRQYVRQAALFGVEQSLEWLSTQPANTESTGTEEISEQHQALPQSDASMLIDEQFSEQSTLMPLAISGDDTTAIDTSRYFESVSRQLRSDYGDLSRGFSAEGITESSLLGLWHQAMDDLKEQIGRGATEAGKHLPAVLSHPDRGFVWRQGITDLAKKFGYGEMADSSNKWVACAGGAGLSFTPRGGWTTVPSMGLGCLREADMIPQDIKFSSCERLFRKADLHMTLSSYPEVIRSSIADRIGLDGAMLEDVQGCADEVSKAARTVQQNVSEALGLDEKQQ